MIEKIVFLGSGDFAVPSLQALIDSERFRPVAVFTQPDRPAGRNLRLTATPVKETAVRNKIPVMQPEDVNAAEAVDHLRAAEPDLLVTVAYGQKLGKAVRETAVYGAVNLHPSLLPQLRGAAPIPFALWQGLIQTGITIFRLTGKMDAGPVYFQRPLYIFPDENATDLSLRMARIGGQWLVQFLDEWSRRPWEPWPQDESKATYCRKLEKSDCLIDWRRPARQIGNQVRALALVPGAYSLFRGKPLKILEAEVIPEGSGFPPGAVSEVRKNVGFAVQAEEGQLLVKRVQPSGKGVMTAWAFHLGARIRTGESFDGAEQV